MFRKILSAVILIPLAVTIVAFAVANRQTVTVSFDPFDSAHPAYAVTLPLFIIVFVLLIIGVLTGGIAVWLRQSSWRRMARQLDSEARQLRDEKSRLQSMLNAGSQTPPAGETDQKTSIALLQQRMH